VKIENPKNGRWVRVRINDCGPFARGRSLDLSLRAAQTIGITHQEVAHVKMSQLTLIRKCAVKRRWSTEGGSPSRELVRSAR
jgi:rare lipoprotein A